MLLVVKQRPWLLVVVILAALALVLGGFTLAHARQHDTAARTAVERYVDLVAAGGMGDIQELVAMASSEDPGGLRAAAELLVGAEERIEVVEVGEAEEWEPGGDDEIDLDPASGTAVRDYETVIVRYRLAGHEHAFRVVVGRIITEDGRDADDWRVLTPLTGLIDWAASDVWAEAYIGGVRQVRQLSTSGDSANQSQALFPAVYSTQGRLDPWFTSAQVGATVVAGERVAPPKFRLDPTQATKDRLAKLFIDRFEACGPGQAGLAQCPVEELVSRAGVQDEYDGRWWRGLVRKPRVTVEAGKVTVTGGVFRFAGPDGVRTMAFKGSGGYFVDNQKWVPVLSYAFDMAEVVR